MTRTLGLLFALLIAGAFVARAQNLVEDEGGPTTAPVKLAAPDADVLIAATPDFAAAPPARANEARRVTARLDRHVAALLEQHPLRPFQNTLGISGHEVYFDHPDALFLSLSIALPQFPEPTRAKVRALLADVLTKYPPYATDGFDRAAGRPRESYDVPEDLRRKGRGQASSILGVYSFWAYAHWANDPAAAKSHWPAVKVRTSALLARPYPFDPAKKDAPGDAAQSLNGDLAGLIALARLARTNADPAIERQAASRALQLLELRINLERTNPRLLAPTKSTSKGLHNAKLGRYCDLVPEVAAALARHTAGLASARVKSFRESHPAWHLAFTERLIGGENYVSPPHLSRALFAGAATIEDLDPATLFTLLDVPWVKGDLYFIEKSALALWADAGRPWVRVP